MKTNTPTFPLKLYTILQDAESEGFSDIISWLPDGKAFKIHKKDKFIKVIMPRYFMQTKYTSFTRQLNLYQFTREITGSDRGSYSHPTFVRDDFDGCNSIRRVCKRSDELESSMTGHGGLSPSAEKKFFLLEDNKQLAQAFNLFNSTQAKNFEVASKGRDSSISLRGSLYPGCYLPTNLARDHPSSTFHQRPESGVHPMKNKSLSPEPIGSMRPLVKVPSEIVSEIIETFLPVRSC